MKLRTYFLIAVASALLGCNKQAGDPAKQDENPIGLIVDDSVKPIPPDVLALIEKDDDISIKQVIYHEWKNDNHIHVLTGNSKGNLSGNGFEFDAVLTSDGWRIQKVLIWQS